MGHLDIRLFGGVEVAVGGARACVFATTKSRLLFARLVLERECSHRREALAEAFWPDRPEGRARAALRTEIWRIHHALRQSGVDPRQCLSEDHRGIHFRPAAPCTIDVERFDDAMAAASKAELDEACADLLREAAALYRGDLLEGDYADWALYRQELYRCRHLALLERLMDYDMGHHAWGAAVDSGNRLLMADPLAEHVHRRMMICHLNRGHRPAALRQYADLVNLLMRELGVGPSEETCALYREIRSSDSGPEPDAFATMPSRALCDARRHLRQASDSLERAMGLGTRPRPTAPPPPR